MALIPVLLALSLELLPAWRRPPWLLALITFVLMAKFYGHELVLGQVNLLFAVIVLPAFTWSRGGRAARAVCSSPSP